MPTASAAKVPIATLTFEEGPPTRLRFAFASGDKIPDVFFHDPRLIQQTWQRAGHYLQLLVRDSPERPRSARELLQPLSAMFSKGTILGQRLAANDAQHYAKVRKAFQRSWPSWANPSPDEIPVVQLVAHDTSFPVELLPVFSNEEIHHLDNDGELATAMQRFLGFTAVIRRVAPGVSSMPDILHNKQKLPIQFLRYLDPERGLRRRRTWSGFEQEQEFMASLGEVLMVDGPWPMSPVTAKQVQQRVVAALFDPSCRLGTAAGPPAELVHFACHCETEDRIDDDYELGLSDEQGRRSDEQDQRLSITLGEIQTGYDRLVDAARQPGPRAPVMLNACGTSTVNPWSGLSFQRWFIQNKHRAFIGTQAAIPDDVAADFAERFYRFLLGGYTFGEAIVLARRQLLADTKSLLGFLYVLFGNDLLKVEVKHPQLLPASPVA
jgi:CHAT domain-containing protein